MDLNQRAYNAIVALVLVVLLVHMGINPEVDYASLNRGPNADSHSSLLGE